MCTKCGEKSKMKTSKLVGSDLEKSYDVNHRAAFATPELGKGGQALVGFCEIMGIPPPSNKSSWDLHNKVLCNAAANLIEKEASNSASRIRNLIQSDDNSIAESFVMNITVSFDDTWLHREVQTLTWSRCCYVHRY